MGVVKLQLTVNIDRRGTKSVQQQVAGKATRSVKGRCKERPVRVTLHVHVPRSARQQDCNPNAVRLRLDVSALTKRRREDDMLPNRAPKQPKSIEASRAQSLAPTRLATPVAMEMEAALEDLPAMALSRKRKWICSLCTKKYEEEACVKRYGRSGFQCRDSCGVMIGKRARARNEVV